jgi:hypothetical protein
MNQNLWAELPLLFFPLMTIILVLSILYNNAKYFRESISKRDTVNSVLHGVVALGCCFVIFAFAPFYIETVKYFFRIKITSVVDSGNYMSILNSHNSTILYSFTAIAMFLFMLLIKTKLLGSARVKMKSRIAIYILMSILATIAIVSIANAVIIEYIIS